MDRVILHSDINSCYASVERLYKPELEGKPFAVCGSQEMRHGIVLAKDETAKRAGVKTGMAIWQARQLCPELEVVEPHFERYTKYSAMVREIYAEYTDLCEPFGIDESWLDITNCLACPDPVKTADEIRRRVRAETGLTVSVGVSWNKVLAKLGSDYKKPDAVTVIDREHFKSMVWGLPASDMLMVGRSTRRELARMGIQTIGEIACTDPELLRARFGKGGIALWRYANGVDDSRVRRRGRAAAVCRQQRHPRAQHRKRVSGASNHAAARRKRRVAPAQAKSALPHGRGRAALRAASVENAPDAPEICNGYYSRACVLRHGASAPKPQLLVAAAQYGPARS